jgi:hypothetical protein
MRRDANSPSSADLAICLHCWLKVAANSLRSAATFGESPNLPQDARDDEAREASLIR